MQTEAGWNTARCTGEAETWAAALNVPLEQQFLWWEMWRASGEETGGASEGDVEGEGGLRQGKKVFVCLR